MKESIIIPVLIDEDGNEKNLSFNYEDDMLSLNLDGEKICYGDWSGNFKLAMERMLKVWGGESTE